MTWQVLAKYQAELQNLRAYLASHPGATPTRVTKAALKEIAPASLQTGAPAALGVGGGQPPRKAWPLPLPEEEQLTPRHVL